ncbi:hypothetical protein GQ42DRAFT_87137 [Ramicandelaber brevisporus]|nr:hypothetical protein GQ42DRAFT_87137 [Ramicandelaber brevisporus]
MSGHHSGSHYGGADHRGGAVSAAAAAVKVRSRKLDNKKHLMVYRQSDMPGIDDAAFAMLQSAVPLVETGVEKEDEEEHHLQAAISAQAIALSTGVTVAGDANGSSGNDGPAGAKGDKGKQVPIAHIPTPDASKLVENYAKLYSVRLSTTELRRKAIISSSSPSTTTTAAAAASSTASTSATPKPSQSSQSSQNGRQLSTIPELASASVSAVPGDESASENKYQRPRAYLHFTKTIAETGSMGYFMDEEDEEWLVDYNSNAKNNERIITEDEFEEGMNELEEVTKEMIFRNESDIPDLKELQERLNIRGTSFKDSEVVEIVFTHWKSRRCDHFKRDQISELTASIAPIKGSQQSSSTPAKAGHGRQAVSSTTPGPSALPRRVAELSTRGASTPKNVAAAVENTVAAFPPIMPMLRSNDGINADSDPYVCFRRRDIRPLRRARRQDTSSIHTINKLHREMKMVQQLVALSSLRYYYNLHEINTDQSAFDSKIQLLLGRRNAGISNEPVRPDAEQLFVPRRRFGDSDSMDLDDSTATASMVIGADGTLTEGTQGSRKITIPLRRLKQQQQQQQQQAQQQAQQQQAEKEQQQPGDAKTTVPGSSSGQPLTAAQAQAQALAQGPLRPHIGQPPLPNVPEYLWRISQYQVGENSLSASNNNINKQIDARKTWLITNGYVDLTGKPFDPFAVDTADRFFRRGGINLPSDSGSSNINSTINSHSTAEYTADPRISSIHVRALQPVSYVPHYRLDAVNGSYSDASGMHTNSSSSSTGSSNVEMREAGMTNGSSPPPRARLASPASSNLSEQNGEADQSDNDMDVDSVNVNKCVASSTVSGSGRGNGGSGGGGDGSNRAGRNENIDNGPLTRSLFAPPSPPSSPTHSDESDYEMTQSTSGKYSNKRHARTSSELNNNNNSNVYSNNGTNKQRRLTDAHNSNNHHYSHQQQQKKRATYVDSSLIGKNPVLWRWRTGRGGRLLLDRRRWPTERLDKSVSTGSGSGVGSGVVGAVDLEQEWNEYMRASRFGWGNGFGLRKLPDIQVNVPVAVGLTTGTPIQMGINANKPFGDPTSSTNMFSEAVISDKNIQIGVNPLSDHHSRFMLSRIGRLISPDHGQLRKQNSSTVTPQCQLTQAKRSECLRALKPARLAIDSALENVARNPPKITQLNQQSMSNTRNSIVQSTIQPIQPQQQQQLHQQLHQQQLSVHQQEQPQLVSAGSSQALAAVNPNGAQAMQSPLQQQLATIPGTPAATALGSVASNTHKPQGSSGSSAFAGSPPRTPNGIPHIVLSPAITDALAQQQQRRSLLNGSTNATPSVGAIGDVASSSAIGAPSPAGSVVNMPSSALGNTAAAGSLFGRSPTPLLQPTAGTDVNTAIQAAAAAAAAAAMANRSPLAQPHGQQQQQQQQQQQLQQAQQVSAALQTPSPAQTAMLSTQYQLQQLQQLQALQQHAAANANATPVQQAQNQQMLYRQALIQQQIIQQQQAAQQQAQQQQQQQQHYCSILHCVKHSVHSSNSSSNSSRMELRLESRLHKIHSKLQY